MTLSEKHIRMARYLLAAGILFIVYNTLIPFRPYTSLHKILREIRTIEYIPFIRDGRFVGLTDIVGNILLFLPVGFLARIVFDHKIRSTLRAIGLGFVLSFFIEFSQIFLHYRIASVHDLMTNTLGAAVGAGLAALFLKRYYRAFLAFVRTLLNAPWESILFGGIGAYLFVFIWISLLTSARLTNGARALLTWGNTLPAFLFFILALLAGDGGRLFFLFRKNRRRVWALFFFVPLLLAFFYNFGLFFWSSLALVTAYLLVRYFGWVYRRRMFISILLIAIYILLDNLQPFVFEGMTGLRHSGAIKGFVPFYYYYKVTSIWNINDLLQMWLEGFLFGKILASASHGRMQTFMALGIGFVVSLGMETAQLFIRGRTMDVTDVGMFVVGVWTLFFIRAYRGQCLGKDADGQIEQGGKPPKKQGIR